MALYSELDIVVAYIRSKTQSFYETLKRDAIAEQLYTYQGGLYIITFNTHPYLRAYISYKKNPPLATTSTATIFLHIFIILMLYYLKAHLKKLISAEA